MKKILIIALFLLLCVPIPIHAEWTMVEDTTETYIFSLASFDGYLYAGSGNNGKIYRSSDGTTWTMVEDTTEIYIRSLASFDGYLYAGSGNNGKIYRSSDGTTWTMVEDTTETYLLSLASFDGYLYAGSGNNGTIYRDSYINISLHSKSPETLFTNYTGLLEASYIVKSDFPLNMSSLAFLLGMNYTLTSDYHSYLKVPGNSIADGGIYRAHNRNTTPYLSWESNSTITEGNVWKWSGGEYGDFWITNASINNTHTWINMTGVASNVFSSMFYLGRSAMYESEKTGIEINRAQGIIFKIWDLEQFRGRSHDYYLSLYFDSQIESTPNANIEIWYCNDSFDPLTDDPCDVCDYKDTWTSDRWMDHESWQPHSNVSYAKPLRVHAGTATCPSSPTEINYIYLKSGTTASKSYILNATNSDPGICNLTFGQTNTMWLRNEISGTNTPHAYTPSFFNTFIRDYLEFTHHMYLANDQGVWGHSDYTTHPIGISDVKPTFCKYNYFWWNDTTDYNMNGSYTEDFWINLTYGFDPDNGAALTHVLSLYDEDYNFVTFVNSSLVGNQTDVDVFFNLTEHLTVYFADNYRFKIVSTDNEGSTSVTWSNLFSIPRESKYKNVATVIRAFPATLQHTLTTLLSYIPLLIGGLIAGVLIILVMSIFGKLKRW